MYVLDRVRPGTNQFHGGIYDCFREDLLDANVWFANAAGKPWDNRLAMISIKSRAEAFSYHKRTMGSGNGAFLAVVAVPRINKLRVINTANSSPPVSSANISFIINNLLTQFNFVQ